MLLFYNQVADAVAPKHPNLLIKGLAYHTYVAPPKDPSLKPRPNLVMQFCRFMCHNHALNDPACEINRDFNGWLQAWRPRTDRLFFYEYYNKGSWWSLPWPIAHTLRQEAPYLREMGLMGVFSQYTPNFGTHGLTYYLAARLLWDAHADVDALTRDFCEKAFGAAAAPMIDYHQRIEQAAIASGVHIAHQHPAAQVIQIFTPGLMAALEEDVSQARTLVLDPDDKARVEMIAMGFEYTRMTADYLRAIGDRLAATPGSQWYGALGPEEQEGLKPLQDQAEAIRRFISAKEHRFAAGGFSPKNNYTARLISPDKLLGSWGLTDQRGDTARIATKDEWLKANKQTTASTTPERFDLWVFGYDLDFNEGKPEHTITARTAEGKPAVVGQVATRPGGNRRQQCCVLKGLSSKLFDRGTLRLSISNDPGGPFSSQFFAFYAMPADSARDDAEATSKIQTDLEWVRQRAFGFTEYPYRGLDSVEKKPIELEIHLPASPGD